MDASHNANVPWLIGLLFVLAVSPASAATDHPAWWSNVVDKTAATNDFAPATQGQLKWIATNAFAELETCLPGGAGPYVRELVAGFSASNNFCPVNLGQLKYVAKPFYDRLIALGYTNSYPWTTNTTMDDSDFAVANLGQLKNVFSFDTAFDMDADQMPDWWEIEHGLNPTTNDATQDPDQDQLNNFCEYVQGTDPLNYDTDGDLLADGPELTRYDTDPTRAHSRNAYYPDWAYKLLAYGASTNSQLRKQLQYPQGGCLRLLLWVTATTNRYEFYYSDDNYVWKLAETAWRGSNGTSTWYDCGGPGRPQVPPMRSFYAGVADDPDHDGLGSSYECDFISDLHGRHYSPDMWDSDTNGIGDGDEDFDNDGLSNSQEYNSPANLNYDSCRQGSSDPFWIDSDNDGVCDGPVVPGPYLGVTNGPDHFPMDPAGWQDTDCDGMPDTLNTNFTSNSYPPLEEDLDDDGDGIVDVDDPSPLDPGNPPNISGTVSYSGGQTGLIHVSATSFDANMQSLIMDYRFTAGGPGVADESGHGHTGQVFGATYTTTGRLGGAYSFDGTNDYIRAYNLGTMSTGTISIWIYAETNNQAFTPGPLNTDYNGGTFRFFFELLNNGRFRFQNAYYSLSYTSNGLTRYNWHHVVFMWNRTNIWGYLNGQLRFADTNKSISTDFSNLCIGFGMNNYSPNYFWKGIIDEVQIYSKILTSQQITNLYLTGFIGAPSSRRETTIAVPGRYVIGNLTNLQTYNISAYRDHNGNQTNDLWEAWGNSSANPIFLSNRFTNANITLVDPDADSDTMPDWWEMAHGLSYTNSSDALGDPDADGLVNRDEYATGGDPNITDYTIFSIPYSTGFESAQGYSSGALANQRGWFCLSTGVFVQTSMSVAGMQSCRVAANDWMKHRFYTTASIITNECSLYLSDASAFVQNPSNMPALASSVLSYDPTQGIMALDGNGSGGGNWVLIDDAAPRQWMAVKIVQNYGAKRWDVYLNGVLKKPGLGFKDNGVSSLSALRFENGSAGETHIDEIILKRSN